MNKDWSSLNKGDKLYLLIPYEENGIIKYEYQESYIITTHKDDVVTYIKFKYTDKIINRRRRMNLFINKTKYDQKYLSVNINTRWARDYDVKFGDMIITYLHPEILKDAYKKLVDEKIKEQKELIESQEKYIKYLENIKTIEL